METTLKGALLAIVTAALVALVGAANQPWWWCAMVRCHAEGGQGSFGGGGPGGGSSGATGTGGLIPSGTSTGGSGAGATSSGVTGSSGSGAGTTSSGASGSGSTGSGSTGSGGTSSGGPASTMSALETATNRHGSDLDQTGIRTAGAAACATLCAGTDACKAMTFVGDLTDPASGGICWMKAGVPAATPAGNMTSAVKQYQ